MERVIAPPVIIDAIAGDDLVAIEAWVAAGGDPNAKSLEMRSETNRSIRLPLRRYETLLHVAAYDKRPAVCEYLLSRGARVNATDAAEGCPTPLWYAVRSYHDAVPVETLATVRVLLSHGADPNLHATDFQYGAPTPLCHLLFSDNLLDGAEFNDHRTDLVPIVRMLLRSGADPEDDHLNPYLPQGRITAEEHARISEDLLWRRAGEVFACDDELEEKASQCAEAADLLKDIRIAGSWPRYFLQPHMRCVVFRALCQRGQATYDHTTPTVLVYLFGAPPSRGYALWREQKQPLRLLRHIDPHMPDLPDVVFWRVLTFMFGTAYDYPWVRPRLRARAAAAAAARS